MYVFVLCKILSFVLIVPSGSPTDVTAIANSSTSIVVSWMEIEPIDQNGIITYYEVTYTPLETFGKQIEGSSVNVSGMVFSTTLMDLQEYVFYNITVRACTIAGSGPNSMDVSERTLEAGELHCYGVVILIQLLK